MIRVWGNQHGGGVVIEGELAELVEQAARLKGMTPEEFVNHAIRKYLDERGL